MSDTMTILASLSGLLGTTWWTMLIAVLSYIAGATTSRRLVAWVRGR